MAIDKYLAEWIAPVSGLWQEAREVWDIIKDFQTLIAGVLAAVIAYRGAVHQSKITVKLARAQEVEKRRAMAAALWSELAAIGLRLHADTMNFTSGIHSPRPLSTEIYASNPSAVGLLPPDEAFQVASVYKTISELSYRYARYRESGSGPINQESHATSGETGTSLAADATKVRDLLGSTLKGFYLTAGIPKDKANAALKIWATTSIE